MLRVDTYSVSECIPLRYTLHEKISCEKLNSNSLESNFCSKKAQDLGFGGAERAGLVSTSTSGTSSEIHQIDPRAARLHRMKRGVMTSARLHEEETKGKAGSFRYRIAMLTLTYRDESGWFRHHISDLMRHIRNWCKRRGIEYRYVWVAELQKRGAVHYHVLIWLPKGVSLPKPDKQGWWPHGFTKIEWARAALGYIAKYASKGEPLAHGFPKGCRISGFGGLTQSSRNERIWWLMPSWVRECSSIEDMPRRAKGGGILLKSTGEILSSPWLVMFTGAGLFIMRKN